jgi:pimeloyl-ACP methyl ester carboxylesterase
VGECEIKEIAASGMTFQGRLAGMDNTPGEPVILLHGFPETSAMWTDPMAKLADEGYRCFAPDQRGYSPGARPEQVESYTYDQLASDVIALADAVGFKRFHLVGHDWGSIVGWEVIRKHPDRVHSWTAMSVPHVDAFTGAIADDPDQQQRSQYIGLFLQKGVAEDMLAGNDFAGLRVAWASIPANLVAEYLKVFSVPGALTAGLNWYRGNARLLDKRDRRDRFGPFSHPTLVIWGNTDIAVGRAGVERTAPYMRGPYRLVELDAGHWLIQEDPERVYREILDHLRANRMTQADS